MIGCHIYINMWWKEKKIKKSAFYSGYCDNEKEFGSLPENKPWIASDKKIKNQLM